MLFAGFTLTSGDSPRPSRISMRALIAQFGGERRRVATSVPQPAGGSAAIGASLRYARTIV